MQTGQAAQTRKVPLTLNAQQFNPVIDPELKNLLPPLSKEELEQLEKNVLADPQHETMPRIIVWPTPKGDLIVDGNNQYALRTKNNLAIEYGRFYCHLKCSAYFVNAGKSATR